MDFPLSELMSLFFGLFLTFFLFVFEIVGNKHHCSVNVEGVHDKSLNSLVKSGMPLKKEKE